MRSGITCLLACLLAFALESVCSGWLHAQEKPPIRLRLTSLSVRNRSSAPIAVQVKLEYNDQNILDGDLELRLYDALDVVSDEDLLATIKVEDLVLSGNDYIFNTIIPPLQTSTLQNLAVQAWFVTKDGETIPLSSSLKEIDPPRPHDLLTISPMERATVLCSCRASATATDSTANRAFLERSLSLENYNPLMRAEDENGVGISQGQAAQQTPQRTPNRSRSSDMGRHIQYYSVDWSARELPLNPLFLCSFDVVLFSDGGFSQLTEEQLNALLVWVRAGGSVCFVADTPLKSYHLGVIQQLFEKKTAEHRFSLDDSGRLAMLTGEQPQMIRSHVGLGRAVLLRADADWSTELSKEELGQLNGFLWKLRSTNLVHRGEKWGQRPFSDIIRTILPDLEGPDNNGLYTYKAATHYYTPDGNWIAPNQQLSEAELRDLFSRRYDSLSQMLAPVSQQLVSSASVGLMPQDVEMVPAWVIALILMAYVITIGPVDYLVLGALKMRKYTWIAFPLVTAVFTGFTILVAHEYMGSTETGGYVEITDLGDDGKPVRQSRLEMLFYGSRTTHRAEHSREMIVASKEMMSAADYFNNMNLNVRGAPRSASGDVVVNYAGRFPDNYRTSQTVQQWSPQLMRSLTFAPEVDDVPNIDWTDPSLVVTEEGRQRLAGFLAAPSDGSKTMHGIVLNSGTSYPVGSYGTDSFWSRPTSYSEVDYVDIMYNGQTYYGAPLPRALIEATSSSANGGFLGEVSQVSPQGSGHLEDLPIGDPTDPNQWVLMIAIQDGSNYRVFRKSYRTGIPEAGVESNE